jgi:mannitol-1-phosphate 5-dehydrogenase
MNVRPVLIWGAGRIGRGFIAETFNQPGYRLTFVDMVRPLIEALRAADGYTIWKATNEGVTGARVESYDALHIDDTAEIMEKLMGPYPIISAAVQASMLDALADMLAPYIRARANKKPDEPMDILLSVNALMPEKLFIAALERVFSGEEQALAYIHNKLGIAVTVVMRITPQTPKAYLEKDPMSVFTNGFPELVADKKGLRGPLPSLPMLRLSEKIEAEEVRKIYTLNLAHATAAYLGMPKKYTYVRDAAKDPEIGPALRNVMAESAVGLIGEYGFTQEDMARWNERMMGLIENPYMEDDLIRLGADSLRKLGPDDRLVGAARLSIKYGGQPKAIANAIRMGFLYENADEGTQTVRRAYRDLGLSGALQKISGLSPDEPLYRMVLDTVH